MFIPNRPFKDVSSTLNCLYDKAIERQKELGLIVFHAFDILYYKGRCVEKLPLYKRKKLLQEVIDKVNSPYVVMVPYYDCNADIKIWLSKQLICKILNSGENTYPSLYKKALPFKDNKQVAYEFNITAKEYYEVIVAKGGEGVILKPKDGKYYHKRGREYQKVKKFLTRELIICGFTEPTKEYTGKFPNDMWSYWVNSSNNTKVHIEDAEKCKASYLLDKGYIPVTRHWYDGLIGQLVLGVLLKREEAEKIPKNKRDIFYLPSCLGLDPNVYDQDYVVMKVCECGGFDDAQRQVFTLDRIDCIGKVVEVKANELFKDSGKMRHPRFLRVREDKNANQCIWKKHIDV